MFRRRIPLFVYCLLFLTVGMTTVRAQNQEQAVAQLPVNISSGQVTAAAGNETVRFSSLGLVRRMRLEVVNQVGDRVFDSDFREGTFIDWKMEDSSRNRLADGLYGCHVTVEELSGHLSHRRGIFWLTAGNAYFTDPPGNRKSTQAADEVQESVTVLRADEGRAIALLAHDGNRGQVVSGKGGLSFRVGDFFSGKDIERMRLTEDGELGIGVEEPGARLDVAGLIRTSEGIVFPDGTIQKSAAGAGVVSASRDGSRAGAEGTVRGAATGGARSPGNAGSGKGNVILARDSGPGPVFAIDGSGTAGKIAKWTSSTLLGDSVLTESADGKIGIGTTTPISHFNVVSTSTSSPRGVTNEQYNNGMDAVQFRGRKARGAPASPAAVQAGDVLGNYVFDAHDGVAFYTGVQIRPVVEEAWTPTAHGAYLALWTTPPGTTTNTEKLRITGVGNVGIGTTTPTSKLTVAGDIESTTGFKIAGASVLGIPGTNNTFAGSGAGQNNTTGSENSFFGQGAGMSNTTGIKHSFFGRLAGMNNTGGIGNSFFGTYAGSQNSTSSDNSFFGYASGQISTGASNSFFGSFSGFTNTTGSFNTFYGQQSGRNNSTASNNSFFGQLAGFSNTTGGSGSFFGQGAGQANTTASGNSFFGYHSGYANTGDTNSFFGYASGSANTTGTENSFFGWNAGMLNTTGGKNSFFGKMAGMSNLTGIGNAFFGTYSGVGSTAGSDSFFGYASGQSNTTGGFNTFVGAFAGFNSTTGESNTFVGDSTGYAITTSSNNSLFGKSADGAAGITNATAIGYRAKVEHSDSLVLGSINGINGATASVNVGIGTTTPLAKLHVEGGDLLIGGPGQGIILKSPDGTKCLKITVDNTGAIATAAQACP